MNRPKTTDAAFQELHGLRSLKPEAGRAWTVSVGFQPAPVAEDTGLDPVTWSCYLYIVSRVRIERFPESKYCTWLIYVKEIGMVETWFTALVVESNSPSQERAWLLKKKERERLGNLTA